MAISEAGPTDMKCNAIGDDVNLTITSQADAGGKPAEAALDIAKQCQTWLREGRTIGLATVADTWGSSPVPIGGQMVIADGANFQGSVSGGCVENEVIVAATEIIETGTPRLLEFGITNETAWQAGLPCGGRIMVFVERLTPDDDLAFIDEVITAREGRRPIVALRQLDTGQRDLFKPGDNAPAEVKERLASGHSGLAQVDGRKVFLQAVVPRARIIVIGGTHTAQAFASMAPLVDLDVVIVDPREAYAALPRFRDRNVIVAWPQDAIPELGLDEYSAVVTLSHVEHIDDEALKLAVKSDCRYIGALGSTRNHARRRERLAAAGLASEEIDRVHSPVGLDIGARTPEEIALSILAEIVLTYRGPRRK